MAGKKKFLTYNQQMRHLRNDKLVSCSGSDDKTILIRAGYFNIINGYKTPFTAGIDNQGNHIYLRDASLQQIFRLKEFDESLRLLLLKYITQIEEEVRTLTGYKLDQCNSNGSIPWFDTKAYSPSVNLQQRMHTISSAYGELSRSRLEYVKFYMEEHEQIPTWIMIKVVNFSTLIDILQCSPQRVKHSLCKLYGIIDQNGKPNVKLLIGSLHWMRKIRNSCAHNERIYCLTQPLSTQNTTSGRILENYFAQLRRSYSRVREKNVFDLIVYFKYYLPADEFSTFIDDLLGLLVDLQKSISKQAFDNVRGRMGIKNLVDLSDIKGMPKKTIKYNSFENL